MVNNDISIKTTFNISAATKLLSVEDLTDYSGLGISLSNAKSKLLITSPNGSMFYSSTYTAPSFYDATRTVSSIVIPLTSDAVPVKGIYTIEVYTLVSSVEYYKKFEYNYQYTSPTLQLEITADGLASTLTSEDSTDYNSLGTIIVKNVTHTVTPPPTSPLSVTSNSSTTISYPANIYSGLWTSELEVDITYLIEGGSYSDYYLVDLPNLEITENVWNIDLDVLRDDINDFVTTYFNLLSTSPRQAEIYAKKLIAINGYLEIYQYAITYVDTLGAYDALLKVTELLNTAQTPSVTEITPFDMGSTSPSIDNIWVRSLSGIISPFTPADVVVIGDTALRDNEIVRINGELDANTLDTTILYLRNNIGTPNSYYLSKTGSDIWITLNNSIVYDFTTDSFGSQTINGLRIATNEPQATIPTFYFRADTDCGIGYVSENTWTLIAGASDIIELAPTYLTLKGILNINDTNTQIYEDGSSNLVFKDANAGTVTLNSLKVSVHNPVTLNSSATTGGLGLSTQEITFQAADGSHNGYLTSTKYTDFNSKQAGDATLTALAGLTITEASLIYGTGTDAFSVLAKGTALQYLRMNAAANAIEWATISLIGGSDTYIQFNDGGSLNGISTFTINKNTNTMGVNNLVVSGTLTGIGDNILDWDSTNKYFKAYATKAEVSTNAYFYNDSSFPDGTNRMNLNGIFYATKIGLGDTPSSSILAATSALSTTIRSEATGSTGIAIYGVTNGTSATDAIAIEGAAGRGIAGKFYILGNLSGNRTSDVVYIHRNATGGVNNVGGNFLHIEDSSTSSGTISGSIIKATLSSTIRLNFDPYVVSGATAIAYKFDTVNNLTDAASQIMGFFNQGNEKAYIDNNGYAAVAGLKYVAGNLTIANINNGYISDANVSGFRLVSTASTATVPTLIPNQGSPNTGIGGASDYLSLINNSVEGLRLLSTGDMSIVRGKYKNHRQTIGTDTNGDVRTYADANGIYVEKRISGAWVPQTAQIFNETTGEEATATWMIADEALSKGNVVCYIQGGTNRRVKKVPIAGNENDMPIGVAYTSAAGAGSGFWCIRSGLVQVLPETGVTPTLGYILTTSASVAGTAASAASAPEAATHFKEIGHWAETGTINTIALADVHWN